MEAKIDRIMDDIGEIKTDVKDLRDRHADHSKEISERTLEAEMQIAQLAERQNRMENQNKLGEWFTKNWKIVMVGAVVLVSGGTIGTALGLPQMNTEDAKAMYNKLDQLERLFEDQMRDRGREPKGSEAKEQADSAD